MNSANGKKDGINAVIAITSGGQDGLFKAVMLRKTETGFSLEWAKTASAGKEELYSFVKEVTAQSKSQAAVVVGAQSQGVVFYRIKIPAVSDSQAEAIVRMQAEALLPLPVEQMQLAWRGDSAAGGGKRSVTIAAGRTSRLKGVVSAARACDVSKIVLGCEGLVKAWKVLSGGGDAKKSVVINTGATGSDVLLVEAGRLVHAVRIDSCRDTRQDGAELFVQDLRNTLELFGIGEDEEIDICVLSNDIDISERLVGYLAEAGIKAYAARPDAQLLASRAELTSEQICEYLEAVGVGMVALDGDGGELDLFEGLYRPEEQDKGSKLRQSLARACVIAAVMLVLCLVVCKWVDKASLARFEQESVSTLIERQRVRKMVAMARPDILDLQKKINSSGGDGVTLDSFTFKKNQPVTISGHAKSYEKLYEFQKSLIAESGIADVKMQNPTLDEKTRQVSFKMTFHYRNFTRKSSKR